MNGARLLLKRCWHCTRTASQCHHFMYQLIKTCSSAGLFGEPTPTLTTSTSSSPDVEGSSLIGGIFISSYCYSTGSVKEINRFKQQLRQWNEVSSFRHHRQNYIWLLDNKRLCFVLNMLQLILWFILTFWSVVTHPWQMSVRALHTLLQPCRFILSSVLLQRPKRWSLSELKLPIQRLQMDNYRDKNNRKAKTGRMSGFFPVIQLSES